MKNYEHIEEVPDRLHRRVRTFSCYDGRVRLETDCFQERESARHRFKTMRYWSRLDRRDSTMEQQPVPKEAVEAALEYFRSQISYLY